LSQEEADNAASGGGLGFILNMPLKKAKAAMAGEKPKLKAKHGSPPSTDEAAADAAATGSGPAGLLAMPLKKAKALMDGKTLTKTGTINDIKEASASPTWGGSPAARPLRMPRKGPIKAAAKAKASLISDVSPPLIPEPRVFNAAMARDKAYSTQKLKALADNTKDAQEAAAYDASQAEKRAATIWTDSLTDFCICRPRREPPRALGWPRVLHGPLLPRNRQRWRRAIPPGWRHGAALSRSIAL